MKSITKNIEALALKELHRANKKNDLFVDENHTWGVIEEELWEAEQEWRRIDIAAESLKTRLFTHDPRYIEDLHEMKANAIKAAAELIQVIAMCDKAEFSMKGKWNG